MLDSARVACCYLNLVQELKLHLDLLDLETYMLLQLRLMEETEVWVKNLAQD